MTVFAFSCELPLLPKGTSVITLWICIFLPSCNALPSPLWISSYCFTEAHGRLLSIWLQPSERIVLVLNWAKRLLELQASLSRAHAREHVCADSFTWNYKSLLLLIQKKWYAKTCWLQFCVTLLKNQVKSNIRKYSVASMHPLNNPLNALCCLLPYTEPRTSTF